jgi:hypothetical protein
MHGVSNHPLVPGVRSAVGRGIQQPQLHNDRHEGMRFEIAFERQRDRARWLHYWLHGKLRIEIIFLPGGLGDAEAGEERFVGCEHTTAGNRVSDTKRSRQVASGRQRTSAGLSV